MKKERKKRLLTQIKQAQQEYKEMEQKLEELTVQKKAPGGKA